MINNILTNCISKKNNCKFLIICKIFTILDQTKHPKYEILRSHTRILQLRSDARLCYVQKEHRRLVEKSNNVFGIYYIQ